MRKLPRSKVVASAVTIVVLATCGYAANGIQVSQFLFSPHFRRWTHDYGYWIFWCAIAITLFMAVLILVHRQHALKSLAELQPSLSPDLPDSRDAKTHQILKKELPPEFVCSKLSAWRPERNPVDSLQVLEDFHKRWSKNVDLNYVDKSLQESLASLIVAIRSFTEEADKLVEVVPGKEWLRGIPEPCDSFTHHDRRYWIMNVAGLRDEVIRLFKDHIVLSRERGL